MVVVSGLAGCLGDDDTTDEGLELVESMFVEHHDVDDWPDGLVERETSEFGPSEAISLFFTVEGFEVDDDSMVDYGYSVTVYTPEGDPYDGIEDEQLLHEVDEVPSDWDWMKDSFGPEIPPEGGGWEVGENEIEFTVVDNIGETELTFTESFDVDNGDLAVSESIFVETHEVETWPEDLAERTGTYSPDENVHQYVSIEGFQVDGAGEVDYFGLAVLFGPDGEKYGADGEWEIVFQDNESVETLEDVHFMPGDETRAYAEFGPSWVSPLDEDDDWEKGEYEVRFLFEDDLSGQEIMFNETFEVA